MSAYQNDMEELLAAVSEREAVDILFRQLFAERERRKEAEALLHRWKYGVSVNSQVEAHFARYANANETGGGGAPSSETA